MRCSGQFKIRVSSGPENCGISEMKRWTKDLLEGGERCVEGGGGGG